MSNNRNAKKLKRIVLWTTVALMAGCAQAPRPPSSPSSIPPSSRPPQILVDDSDAWLARNLLNKGVEQSITGLQYKILRTTENCFPDPTAPVVVHYKASLTNGVVFDSTYDRGTPGKYPLDKMIAGWTEGIAMMRKGEQWEFYVPPRLAYGTRGSPPVIKPDDVLVFLVELIDVERCAGSSVSYDVGSRLKRAADLIASGDYNAAKIAIDEAAAFSPKSSFENFKISEVRAYSAMKQRDYLNAEVYYSEMLRLRHLEQWSRLEYLRIVVKLAALNKHHEAAISFANASLASDANDTEAIAILVQSYYGLGDFDRCAESAERLIRAQASTPDGVKSEWLVMRVGCVDKSQGTKAARAERDNLIKRFPQHEARLKQ